MVVVSRLADGDSPGSRWLVYRTHLRLIPRTLILRVAIYYYLLVVLLFIAGPWPSQSQPSGCMRQLLCCMEEPGYKMQLPTA